MNLTRIDVRYTGLSGHVGEVVLGLVKRSNTVRYADQREGWLSLWGPVDETASHGLLGTGIVAPAASTRELREDSVHEMVIASLSPGNTFLYSAGAGWTLSGDFADVEEWNGYLALAARSRAYPLAVKFSD